MSTFEETRHLFDQTHFTIVEIDLPVVEGACTISGEPGFGTPLSCDQPSDAIKTYKFAEVDSPILPGSGIYRLITNISETPTELKSGRGIASRASLNITFTDIVDADPNPFAPGVNDEVKAQATYMAKFAARNVFKNRKVRIKNYRVEADGSIDLENGAETRHYITESLNGKNFKWSLTCKDELSRINIGESVWPLPLEGELRSDINDVNLSFNVDANVNYQVGDAIRIGEELMKISSVGNIGTGSAVISTLGRGVPVNYSSTLSLTETESHSAKDEIYVCEISDNEKIYDLLERILLDIGIDASLIPKADWIAEIDEWLPLASINTLWIESKDTAEVLEQILTNYLIDMWFDPVAREIKLSAINVWKESSVTVSENNQLDFESISKKSNETLRVTRAFVVYNKRFLATSDSVENYKQASLFKRTELESDDLFGEPKTRRFDFSHILDKDSADLLVNRTVNRYIDPQTYIAKTQERKLNYKTGDIVNLDTTQDINFDGSNSETVRAQVISVKTNYTKDGRDYTGKFLSYEPVFSDNSEIVIDGSITDINLYIKYAGAPSQAVNITFVFDGAVGGGTSGVLAAIQAGAFPAGSKLILILVNGADLQGQGGFGGRGGSDPAFGHQSPGNGNGGGIVYDAQGVDTDIYFSGATPSANYPVADGFIRAPSGGDGGFDPVLVAPNSYIGGKGGDGGSGRNFGQGGPGGSDAATGGTNGANGNSTSGFGLDGADNDASGGGKGAGIRDNGATVNLFGDTPTRYINGSGDH